MSTPPEAGLETCATCGATIYPEHIARRTADRVAGRLLCPHCLAEARQPATAHPEAAGAGKAEGDILLLDEEAPPATLRPAPTPTKIVYNEARVTVREYRRQLLKDSTHATRCRIFHCKLNDASLTNLSEQINDWVDANDDIVIKFSSSTIGVVEGKHPDPHLIVTIFY